MRFHSSDEVVACEKHSIYAEDSCLECEVLKELETAGVSPGTGKVIKEYAYMIGKFVGTKSEWKKKLERIERNGGRRALDLFFSLPF